MIVFKSIVLIGTFVIFLSFLYSFTNRNRRSLPKFLQFFYVYPLLALMVSVNAILYLFMAYNHKTGLFIEQIYSVLELIFWLYFFYHLVGNVSKAIKIYLFIATILALVLMILSYHYERPGYIGIGISNFAKCLFCLTYFYNLFHRISTVILKKEPVFWIVTGLFFYTSVTLPTYMFNDYLFLDKAEISFFLMALSNIAIIIMHLFFIRSHVWITQGQQISKQYISDK